MTLIIAEIGVNHCGDEPLAMELIKTATESGADAVKFQLFTPEKLDPPGERRSMLEQLAFAKDQFARLKNFADAWHVDFIGTPFDEDWLDFLVELGCDKIKIASGNFRNVGLLRAAKVSGKKVILSTGMATGEQVKAVYDELRPWALLHCTSSYPCDIEDVNLESINWMKARFDCKIGLSDHTTSTRVPAIAVALGAEIIEKHFTMSRALPGPDHEASLTPLEFSEMYANIAEVEQAMGIPGKHILDCEEVCFEANEERRRWREQQS